MPKKVIFDKKNILVTGGAGFIGSHLCDELIKDSKVICVDNFSSGSEKNIDHLLSDPNFEFIKHDMTKPLDLSKYPELQKFKIEFQGIQEIYHLACPMSPKNFEKNKIEVVLANSYGVKNALDLACKYSAKFVHASSSVIYGDQIKKGHKITENELGETDPISPRASYDEGKRFAETIVESYREIKKVDAKILRIFRTYGPRMKIGDGQMIPDFINNALDGKDLLIHGDNNFSSSFCYVSDSVDALTKAMDVNFKGPINIGSDVEIKLEDLANRVISIMGANVKIKYEDHILFMKSLNVPDISKARNELEWMPVISLDKGLEMTIYELRASKGLKGYE